MMKDDARGVGGPKKPKDDDIIYDQPLIRSSTKYCVTLDIVSWIKSMEIEIVWNKVKTENFSPEVSELILGIVLQQIETQECH